MATIYINEGNNYATRYDDAQRAVARDFRDCPASRTAWAMGDLLEEAKTNTNATFNENGKTEVDREEWNKEFVRNVEFLMVAGTYDSLAVGNLKHYGFKP